MAIVVSPPSRHRWPRRYPTRDSSKELATVPARLLEEGQEWLRMKLKMSNHLSGLCSATLAISLAVATALPANAVPLFVPRAVAPSSDTVEVQSPPPIMGPG